MLATSWIAKGLVRPVWKRLGVPAYKREELSRLTGIPATNLSAMNTGKMPMTMETAQRIAAAVPGVTVLDLGAPEAEDDAEALTALHRLARLEDTLERVLEALAREGIALPDAPAALRSGSTARRSQRRTAGSDG